MQITGREMTKETLNFRWAFTQEPHDLEALPLRADHACVKAHFFLENPS